MGLDQYIVAKVKGKKETGGLTGACGGLFPMAPKSDKTEIGYWRKFYKLDELIMELKGFDYDEWEEMNCEDVRLYKKDCQHFLDYAKEEVAEIEDWYDGDLDKIYDSDDGWDYQHWKDTEEFFQEALNLITEEHATIYYKYWR